MKVKIIRTVIAAVLFFVLTLVITSMIWCMGYWHDITVDEILFHLNAPIEGTAENVMTAFYLKALLPAVLITAVFVTVTVILHTTLAKVTEKDRDIGKM